MKAFANLRPSVGLRPAQDWRQPCKMKFTIVFRSESLADRLPSLVAPNGPLSDNWCVKWEPSALKGNGSILAHRMDSVLLVDGCATAHCRGFEDGSAWLLSNGHQAVEFASNLEPHGAEHPG